MDILDLLTRWRFKTDAKPLDAISEKLDGIQHRLEFLGAAEAVRGIFEMVERFSGMAEQLQASAQSAGLTVEALQKLQFAGSMSAVSAGEMTSALARLSRVLYQAKEGSEEAQKQFAGAGISLGQLKGFRTGADALAALADRMQGMSDPAKKQALAMQLLGRGAYSMVPLLSKGAQGLREMSAEAEEVGAVLSGRQVRALAEAEDALSALWQVVKTFSAGIAARFAPAIEKAVHAVLGLYKANRKFIEQNLTEWARNVTYAFGFVYGVIEGLIIHILRFAKAHETLIDKGGKLVLALGALALGASALKGGLGLLQTSLSFLLAPLVALVSPAGLVVAGLAALVLISEALYTVWYKGGKFKDTWLGQMLEGLQNVTSPLVSKLMESMSGVPKLLGFHGPDAKGPKEIPAPEAPLWDWKTLGQDAHQNIVNLGLRTREDPQTALAQDPARTIEPSPSTVNIHAPMTFNVPAGTHPEQVGRLVRDGVNEHVGRLLRETHRGLKPGMAH